MNKQVLWRIISMFDTDCGTPRIEAIGEMGREKYYSEQSKEMWNLFNELDKTSLPEKEIEELEEELKVEEENNKLAITGDKEKKIKDSRAYDICIRLLKHC